MIIAYHLHFRSPVHVGIESIGQEKIEYLIRSDTLWGAIISKWLLLFNDDPETLCLEPNFAISSCFPLIHGVRFFPVPLGALDILMNEAAKLESGKEPTVKTIKKIKFIAEPFFEKLRSGESLQFSDLGPDSVYPWEAPVQNDTGLKRIKFSNEIQRPRIRTNQASGGVEEDSFFYCSDQFFSKDSGQFFLARFNNEESQKKFEASLLLLGDSGIGADRSVGRGLFSFNSHKIKNIKEKGQKFLLLSLCIPNKQEVESGLLTDEMSRYGLVRRFGRAGDYRVNRFRRPDCWMLEEGSVFPVRPEGRIHKMIKASSEVPHDVYRNGKAFCLPVAL